MIDKTTIWSFHAQVQGVTNAVAELLSEAIGEQDEALLAMLQTELRTVREWILGNKQSPKAIFEKLEIVRQQIGNIEHHGIQNAVSILQGTVAELTQIAGQHTKQMLEAILDNEKAIRRRSFKSELTDRSA